MCLENLERSIGKMSNFMAISVEKYLVSMYSNSQQLRLWEIALPESHHKFCCHCCALTYFRMTLADTFSYECNLYDFNLKMSLFLTVLNILLLNKDAYFFSHRVFHSSPEMCHWATSQVICTCIKVKIDLLCYHHHAQYCMCILQMAVLM